MTEEFISRAEAVKAANEWVSEACMAPVMRVSRLFDKLAKVPAADVAEVVHGTPVTEVRTRTIVGYREEIGVLAGDRSTLYRRNMVHVDIPYDHCPICGATLCSRWHNFCGKCGARMDGSRGVTE